MNKFEKIAIGSLFALALLIGVAQLPIAKTLATQLYNSQYNYAYFNTNGTSTACIVISGTPGTLHALTVGTPGLSGVVTLYDSNSGSVSSMTNATATIWIGPTATATSTVTGTLAIVLNGQTVTSASVANGSSTTNVATSLTTAITASSTVLGVTATSSNNIITITASEVGAVGNINLPPINAQNGFTFSNAFTNSAGTQVISQMTFAATTTYQSYPETALYDSAYKNGLCIQETTATSGVTVSWQIQ
jgi:hypothetical protein